MLNVEHFGAGLAAELNAMLAGRIDAAALSRAVAHAAAAAEAVCRNRPMACAAGCPHCCVLNVAVLLPEGLAIAAMLQAQLAPAALDSLRQRLATHSSWVRWMDDEERTARTAYCPLLDAAGRCTVHPVRPLSCRGIASLDSSCCREAFNPVISDQERLVPADLLRRMVYDEAFRALARALRSSGLSDRSIDLVEGLRAFLERPGCRELYLSGGELPGELWG